MNEKIIENLFKQYIESNLGSQTFNSYFKEIRIKMFENGNVKILCPNNFVLIYIKSKFSDTILNYLSTQNPNMKKVIYETFSTTNTATSARKRQGHSKSHLTDNHQLSAMSNSISSSINQPGSLFLSSTTLNPNYTFETFVPGNNNLLAHAASRAVADSPGKVYNPLFIYGDVGLGKTHLMQSIGNVIRVSSPHFKILYCTTEQFLNDMVSSIKSQKSLEFRSKYRSIDLLLLDDIQFISNKVALQEEFFNTFNALYQSGRQIVIASDRPPSEIQHLEDRIRSRFEGGLVADVQKPDYETRIAIIEKKLQQRNEYVPREVIYKLAEIINSNIRELEGAVLKLSLLQKSQNKPITILDLNKLFNLKLSSKAKSTKKVSYLEIIKAVSSELEVSIRDIKSTKRSKDVSFARHICMYLIKEILNLNLQKIASILGRKDHTTIIHGIKKIKVILESDPNSESSQIISSLLESLRDYQIK